MGWCSPVYSWHSRSMTARAPTSCIFFVSYGFELQCSAMQEASQCS